MRIERRLGLVVALVFPLLVVSSARANLVTLTFDELPFQPVDGLSFMGVTFGFTINGIPSTDANYNSFGPGIITYVQDPSLEGNALGVLALDFDVPTPFIQFGIAFSTLGTFPQAASVELFDADLESLGTFDVSTTSLISFTEGQFNYESVPASRMVVTMTLPDALRFAFDNLVFDDGSALVFDNGSVAKGVPSGKPWPLPKQ